MSARRGILDDVAKLATSAAGLMQGAGQEVESALRQRLERVLDAMELVPRDEFDALKAVAAAARADCEDLAARLEKLEAAIQAPEMTTNADTSAKAGPAKSRAGTKAAPARRRKTAAKKPQKPRKTKE